MGGTCDNAKICLASNECPTGCSFVECLRRAKLENADGFSYRDMNSTAPTCSLCTSDQLKYLDSTTDGGVYRKQGILLVFTNILHIKKGRVIDMKIGIYTY